MSFSGSAFTSQRDGVDLTRLVNSLTAFETVMGIEEPHYRLIIIYSLLACSGRELSNTDIKNATGWALPRVQSFLEQLRAVGLVDQWNEGRSQLNKLTPEGLEKAQRLTTLLQM